MIDTGATACYIKKGTYQNGIELPIYKRVSTVNGYSTIKKCHYITIFQTKQIFYEIEGLKADLLIGYNLLKKIGAVIDTNNDTLKCKGKIEKLHYDEKINLLELNKETTILPLKKYILDKYFNYENLSS
ncbi:Prgag-pol, putative, partial [Wolbachia endosymbiont of Drosophila ananassae]